MTFLPIVDRELRVRARHSVTYWNRFTVGLCGALVCLVELLGADAFGGVGRAGGYAFQGLVIAAFVICCGCCLFTSDAISWERREGTLGLLFLTRVRGPDVVLGKLTSAALVNVCAVMAFLPVLVIPVLSGGVTGGEAFRKGLVLLDTLFLALAAGLWASARGFEAFKTARAALGIVLTILLLPWLLQWLLPLFALPPFALATLSPIFGLEAARDLTYQSSSKPYWISLVVGQILAWLLILGAGVRLRKSLQEPARLAGQPAQGTPADAAHKTSMPRARFTDATTPVGWLVRRQNGLRLMIWSAVVVGAVFYVGRMFLFRVFTPTMAGWVANWPVSFAATIISGGLFAWAASRFFVEAKRTGELELLATTPLGARTIVSEQWNVLRRMFRWPLGVMLLPFLLQPVFLLYPRWSFAGWPWAILYLVSTLLWAANTVVGVWALCWLGMWYGFKSPTQTGAIVKSLALGKVVPFCISFVCPLVVQLVGATAGLTPFVYWGYFSLSWLPQIVILGFYLWLIKRVKQRLLGELREADAAGLWWNMALTLKRVRHWTPA